MSTTELLPSMREATIANTEKFGPKVGHRVTAAELAARAAEEAANAPVVAVTSAHPTTELLPSVREATIANTEKYGPKVGSNRPSEPGSSSASHMDVGTAPSPVAGAKTATPAAAATAAGTTAAKSPSATIAARAAPASAATAVKTPPAPTAAVKTPPTPAKTTASSVAATKSAAASNAPAASAKTATTPSAFNTSSLTAKVAMGLFAVGAAALTVFSIYKGVEMYNRYRLRQCVAQLEQQQPEVVHVYIYRRSPLAPSISVPCTRLETFLRATGIPYEAHVVSDPSISPNGRLPFVAFGGEQIGDIPAIIARLSSAYGIDIDRQLTREDRAVGTALLATLNYSLTKGYLRSVHVDAPDLICPYYSEMNQTPDWLTRMALGRMRKDVVKTHTTTGYAKLTVEQYQSELLDDVQAIEGLLLNGTDFLFSNAGPCTYDCALYAWLLPIIAMEEAAEVNEAFEYAVQSEPITAYVKRMTDLAFPDLDELVNEGRADGSRSRARSVITNEAEEREAIENIAAADAEVALAEATDAAEAAEAAEAAVQSTRGIVDVDSDTTGAIEEPEKMAIPMVDSPTGIHDDTVVEINIDADEL